MSVIILSWKMFEVGRVTGYVGDVRAAVDDPKGAAGWERRRVYGRRSLAQSGLAVPRERPHTVCPGVWLESLLPKRQRWAPVAHRMLHRNRCNPGIDEHGRCLVGRGSINPITLHCSSRAAISLRLMAILSPAPQPDQRAGCCSYSRRCHHGKSACRRLNTVG
jgi:hypothetical protein